MSRLVVLFGVLGVAVWIFAVIGFLSVANTIATGGPSPSAEPRLLEATGTDVDGAEVEALPRYPGSERAEYRHEPYGGLMLTEVEYVTRAGVNAVRSYYVDAFDRHGWAVGDVDWVRGEWVFRISAGSRNAVVEIERVAGVTEVEIEVTERAASRGAPSDR